MRCLSCGSKLHGNVQHCEHCLCDSAPAQDALDGLLCLSLLGAMAWYVVKDPIWMLLGEAITLALAILVIFLKRRETMRTSPRHGSGGAPAGAGHGVDPPHKPALKLVEPDPGGSA